MTPEPLSYFSNHQHWWFRKEVTNKSPFLSIVFCRKVPLHCPSLQTMTTHISSILPASQIGLPSRWLLWIPLLAPQCFIQVVCHEIENPSMAQLLIQSVSRPKSLCAFNPKHLDKYISGSICYLVLFASFPNLTSTVTFFRVSKWADSVVASLCCHVTYQMSQL